MRLAVGEGPFRERVVSQIEKDNMAELFRAEISFEAALKMTKVNMTWLSNQVFSILWKVTNLYDQDGGIEGVKKMSTLTGLPESS